MLYGCSAEPAVLAHRHALLGGRSSSSLAPHRAQNRRPSRGGQNLTTRYQRLARSIRENHAQSQNIPFSPRLIPSPPSVTTPTSGRSQTFRGFPVPQEPKPPESDECCMSGCAVCVYDLYDKSLQAYKQSITTLQKSLSALGIPDTEWPASVRPQSTRSPNAKLDAFEAMELALKAKRENEQGESKR